MIRLHRAIVLLTLLVAAAGCRHADRPGPKPRILTIADLALPPVPQADSLPLKVSRQELTKLVISKYDKRIRGKRNSLADIERIVTQVGPIAREAAEQPQVQSGFRQMARETGVSVKTMKAQWIALQEADLMLESGGDPDAVSQSLAVGVAQWMEGTGRGNGLKVDIVASGRLSQQIVEIRRQIAWREYRLRPDADPRVPGALPITREQCVDELPALRVQLEKLREQRRKADARYNPRPSIFAQTRYLLRIYSRFPNVEWLFQAYHGGEGGVTRTLKKFLGKRWPGSSAAAIRHGRNGRRLTFEDIYFETTPHDKRDAFAYLYGRGDDHRHYWWKLRASHDAIALYRKDPAGFQKQWEAYLPGRPMDGYWYPDAPKVALADLQALQQARALGVLLPVPTGPNWYTAIPEFHPENATSYACLRPETLGLLTLVASAYRKAGGNAPLRVGDLTYPVDYSQGIRAAAPVRPIAGPLWPPDPEAAVLTGGGPPPDFDFHVTGLAFDLLRPEDAGQRKILEYALCYFENRHILTWADAKDRGFRRYHVVPNPKFAHQLEMLAHTDAVPALPGL